MGMRLLSQLEKILLKLLSHPIPNGITFQEMAKFLKNIGCKMRKRRGTSHRIFSYPGYLRVITLMENEDVREYQVNQVKALLKYIGIIKDSEEE